MVAYYTNVLGMTQYLAFTGMLHYSFSKLFFNKGVKTVKLLLRYLRVLVLNVCAQMLKLEFLLC